MPARLLKLEFNPKQTPIVSWVAMSLLRNAERRGSIVFIEDGDEARERLATTLHALSQTLAPNANISILNWPAFSHLPDQPIALSLRERNERLDTLRKITSRSGPSLILTSTLGVLQPTLPASLFKTLSIDLSVSHDMGSLQDLGLRLMGMGYRKAELVQESGQFAVRGDIFDIFVPGTALPYRIDCFDTQVERIRTFDPESQRSSAELLQACRITPAEEAIVSPLDCNTLIERIKADGDQRSISRKIRDPIVENIRNGFPPENFRHWLAYCFETPGQLTDYLEEFQFVTLNMDPAAQELKKLQDKIGLQNSKHHQEYWIAPTLEHTYLPMIKKWEPLLTAAPTALLPPEELTPSSLSRAIEQRTKFLFYQTPSALERLNYWNEQNQAQAILVEGRIFGTLIDHRTQTAFIDEVDILGKAHIPAKERKIKFKVENPEDYAPVQDGSLDVGDAVVHATHGIGKYQGLTRIKSQGTEEEFLLITYAGGDKLYLPVYRLNLIQKYVGGGTHPALDRLGHAAFDKAKEKARSSAKALAINLMEIYAKRTLQTGPNIDPCGESYDTFSDQFAFTLTEGQERAIHDIFADFQSGKLLDRLVCGDVGFGKTEVAMRAAFQVVQSGYQVAVLVPTTLLAFQHEQTFKKRFKDSPIRTDSLSRFKSKREQNEILKQVESGQIDILIGTHRLLSKDVKFNRLGLLAIDEEHRFGVEHKEKIKALNATAHTLTLTATPIPRTLNMALAGIKDISLIKSPPTNRQAIRTTVAAYSDEIVRSAIQAEIDRGGQIYVLHNRVETISKEAQKLREFFPKTTVRIAHGQMPENEVEDVMLDFYRGNTQILVCTTLIESGIDVPNAGTIIIHRADQLGLAQLYQIRGRVGRSHRKSYAYLLVSDTATLTDDARKRLDVLQRFVDLGSGFHVASHDLEIRGGGNFVGPEQSGHISAVGLDLFIEMLGEAVAELKGAKKALIDPHFEPELKTPVICDIPVTFIESADHRLALYRRLNFCKTESQLDDAYQNLRDRHGELPQELQNFFALLRIKLLAKTIGIESVSVKQEGITLTALEHSRIDGTRALHLAQGPKDVRDSRVKLLNSRQIFITTPFKNLSETRLILDEILNKLVILDI